MGKLAKALEAAARYKRSAEKNRITADILAGQVYELVTNPDSERSAEIRKRVMEHKPKETISTNETNTDN